MKEIKKECYGKCERCVWFLNSGCSEWNYLTKVQFMNYYEYELRKCGNDWRYCDGKCYQCDFILTTTTVGLTEFKRSDNTYSNKTADGQFSLVCLLEKK